jgi:glycerol kinase
MLAINLAVAAEIAGEKVCIVDLRGALFGLTRNTGPAELAHAALESVCYQTFDLREAIRADWTGGKAANVLRVDGLRLDHAAAGGPARRAGRPSDDPGDHGIGRGVSRRLQVGIYPEPAKFADNWRLEHRFKPAMSKPTRERKLAGWARREGRAGERRGRGLRPHALNNYM